jgi:leucyl-tRNA synthetase
MTTPSFYIVPMFPYPSGRLHMGHVRNYAISDTLARHHRRQGERVLHPIGWDAFGLPAENAARQQGADPRAWTDANIEAMRVQLHSLGFEFDQAHELATHTPDYIRAGQSLFLRFYRAGLIERRSGEVWWDPVDQTVLANEQVINGCGWRSGAPVQTKVLSMLYARIKEHVVDLDAGLDALQWPSQAKAAQKAWIGAHDTPIRLRDWCLSRQRSWGTPVPLVDCGSCGEVPADEASLPLPNLPTHATEQDRTCACPSCGQSALRSNETLDTFWDSAFYTYAYPGVAEGQVTEVAGPAFQEWSKVDLYIGGLEHSTMHLLYARWFARALRTVGIDVPAEPFTRLIGQGMVCAPAFQATNGSWVEPSQVRQKGKGWVDEQGRPVEHRGVVKMSKSKKNGVDPAEAIAQHGPEAVRFAMLFAAPYGIDIAWEDHVLGTAAHHLTRIIGQASTMASAPAGSSAAALSQAVLAMQHKAVSSYDHDEGLNAMMGACLGVWRQAEQAARAGQGDAARSAALAVGNALWPVAPRSIEQAMRCIDPAWTPTPLLAPATAVARPLVIQINGRKRAVVETAMNSAEEAMIWLQANHPEVVSAHLPHGVARTIWQEGKVVNFVAAQGPKALIKP